MGEQVFTKNQIGKESAAARGTAVAATTRWMGSVQLPADRKPVFPQETLGNRARAQRAEIYSIMADKIKLVHNDLTFQSLILPLMSMKGGITPAEQTAGQHDYLWDASHSLSADNTPDSITLQTGDDTQAYQVEYLLTRGFKISGTVGKNSAAKLECDCFGKQITPISFTNSINPYSGAAVSADVCQIWIDDTWAHLGTTLKGDILREYSIEILTGLHPKTMANNGKVFTGHGQGFLDCMAAFTFDGIANADAQFDLFQAGTARAIRFKLLGAQIGTGVVHSFTLDMFGTWEEVIPLAKTDNGDNLHTLIFHTHSDGLATPHHFSTNLITDRNTL